MSKLTTAKRIILGFAIAPLALITVAIYALHDLSILKEQAVAIVEQDWPKVAPILTISNNLRENGKNTRDLLINDEKATIYKAIEATRDSTGQALATLKPLLNTPSGTELYEGLLQSREVYVKAFTAVVTLIKNGQRELALEAVQRQLIPSEQAVYASLNAVM
ncbi:Chemotaxis sensory transducer [Pseudomonas syringae pv. maculicola]|nr:Chemotaxis sensory transducer [Pseudomonas syringae pv. maculicola]